VFVTYHYKFSFHTLSIFISNLHFTPILNIDEYHLALYVKHFLKFKFF